MHRAVSPQSTPRPLAFGFHNDASETLTALQPSTISHLTELALEFESAEDVADGLLYILSHAASLMRMHLEVPDFDNNYATAKPETLQQLAAVRCPSVRILELEMVTTAYTVLGALLLQALPNLERLVMTVVEGAGYDSSDGDNITPSNWKSNSNKRAASRTSQTTLSKLRRVSFNAHLPLEFLIARTSTVNLHHLSIRTDSTAVISAVYNAGLAFQLPIRTLLIDIHNIAPCNDADPNLLPIAHMEEDDRALAVIRVLPYLEQLVVCDGSCDILQMLDAVRGSLRALYIQRLGPVAQTIADALKDKHRALARLRLYGLPPQLESSLPGIHVPAIFGERRINVQKGYQLMRLIGRALDRPTHF